MDLRSIRAGMRVLAALGVLCLWAWAEAPELYENQNAAAVRRQVERLRTTLTVLHITAHPDDEDGALLTG